MKTALIEYHRERQSRCGLLEAMTSPNDLDERDSWKRLREFHEQAVAWLERLSSQAPYINEREPKVYSS